MNPDNYDQLPVSTLASRLSPAHPEYTDTDCLVGWTDADTSGVH